MSTGVSTMKNSEKEHTSTVNRMNNEGEMGEKSEIREFFEGQTVLLTGGTGFLGKLLIDKLLRDCSGLRKIYLLVRQKRGKTEKERFNEIFDAACFEPLKAKYPNFLEKLCLMNGDCSKPDIGLDDASKEIVLKEVTSIFHVAATVRFDQHLRTAAYINVRSVRDLLRMAHQMPQLKTFLYVSTAYSQCPYTEIKEKFYKPPISSENLFNIVESLDDESITKITPILLKDWPNGYVFTKAVAESVVEENGKGLPVAIVRPAIVSISAKEPIVGWIDNIYGVNGVVAGAGLGILRTMPSDPDVNAEVVPVDFVINTIIVAAWDIAKKSSEKEQEMAEIPIYNFVLSPWQKLTWGIFFQKCYEYGYDYPSNKAIWHFCFKLRPNPISHEIALFFLHTIPAYIMDFLLICFGRKTMAVEGYRKARKFLDVIAYFATRNWKFEVENVRSLLKKPNGKDREIFYFDLSNNSMDEVIKGGIVGGRVHLLKDPLDTIPQAKRRRLIFQIAHYILCGLLLYLLFKVLFLIFSFVF